MTRGIRNIVATQGHKDDLIAFMGDHNHPSFLKIIREMDKK